VTDRLVEPTERTAEVTGRTIEPTDEQSSDG